MHKLRTVGLVVLSMISVSCTDSDTIDVHAWEDRFLPTSRPDTSGIDFRAYENKKGRIGVRYRKGKLSELAVIGAPEGNLTAALYDSTGALNHCLYFRGDTSLALNAEEGRGVVKYRPHEGAELETRDVRWIEPFVDVCEENSRETYEAMVEARAETTKSL